MNLTINKMVDLFQEWSRNKSPLINDFYFGDIYDINSSVDVKYPLMVVDLSPTSLSYANGRFENRVNFIVGFFDQENNQLNVEDKNGFRSSNVGEILSDSYQLVQDLMHDFVGNNNWRAYGISTSNGDKNVDWKMNIANDKIWGCAIELDIKGLYKC